MFGLFEYNLSIYHYITDKANIEQINIFDLQGKYALKITGEIKNGFIHYVHCELLEDEQYIAYKPGDNQEVIIEFLKSQTEAIPERYLDNKYNWIKNKIYETKYKIYKINFINLIYNKKVY